MTWGLSYIKINFGKQEKKAHGQIGRVWGSRVPCVLEIGSLVPGLVKQMTYKMSACRFLSCRSALLRKGKDWLTQCQDNVTVGLYIATYIICINLYKTDFQFQQEMPKT